MTVIPVVYVKGQYNHLIARTLSDLGVDSTLIPSQTALRDIDGLNADALVMGGGPQRVRTPQDLTEELKAAAQLIKQTTVPLLCICVTHQLLATVYGGATELAKRPEFGPVDVSVLVEGELFEGLKPSFKAWESHNDEVVKPPHDFLVLASSENCAVQAMRHVKSEVFGVQFHPEVSHTSKGVDVFRNFLKLVRK